MEQENTLFDLQIDHEGSNFLSQAAKWGRFLSIVGVIMVGLLVVFSFFASTVISSFSGYGGQVSPLGPALGGFITILYLVIALLWLMPVIYLYRFSTKMLISLRTRDQVLINQSFRNLKSCFRYMGIMTIIVMSIYALVFIITMATFVIGSAAR